MGGVTKVDKIKRVENTRGVDAWRYVKHVAIPLMWPACRRRLQDNPEFVLMEDCAASHTAQFTAENVRSKVFQNLKNFMIILA